MTLVRHHDIFITIMVRREAQRQLERRRISSKRLPEVPGQLDAELHKVVGFGRRVFVKNFSSLSG
jgi:hypothetical protein